MKNLDREILMEDEKGKLTQVKLGCLKPKINGCPYSLTSRECEEFDEYQCNPCLKSYHKKSGGKE